MSRKVGLWGLLLFGIFASASAAWGQTGILDSVVGAYGDAGSGWLPRALEIGQKLFLGLAGIELLLTMYLIASGKGSGEPFFHGMLWKFFTLLFLYALIIGFPLFIPRAIEGFQVAGQRVGAVATLSPSGVLDVGVRIGAQLLKSGPIYFVIPGIGSVFVASILIVFLSFVMIAVTLAMTIIESYLVLTAGALFLGFAGSRWTAPLAENYLAYATKVGVRLFLVYVLIGGGLAVSQTWAATLAATPFDFTLRPLFETLAGAVTFAFVVFRVPQQATASLSSITFGLREALKR